MLLGRPKPKEIPKREPAMKVKIIPLKKNRMIVENIPKIIQIKRNFLLLTFFAIAIPMIAEKIPNP